MDRILMVFAAGAKEVIEGVNKVGGGGDGLTVWGVVSAIINVALWVIGVLAVGFIIYGGIKYSMSAGDASKVKSAKDTIMYAVVGLIVAILAYAIVNFVIGAFTGDKTTETETSTDKAGGGGGRL